MGRESVMRRLNMLLGRIGGAAFCPAILSGVLGRVLSAPSVVRVAELAAESLSARVRDGRGAPSYLVW